MQPLPPSACICTTLRRATRALTRSYDEAMAPHGLTIQQFAILRHIREQARNQGPDQGAIPLSHLAARLVMDRTSLYRALPPLERAGLIALESLSARHRTARITPQGEQRIAQAEPAWAALQQRILATMAPGEWQALRSSADHLAQTLASQDLAA
jgi:DNA-binding MarR family transcriptional regulator